jgi:hypothetical protein
MAGMVRNDPAHCAIRCDAVAINKSTPRGWLHGCFTAPAFVFYDLVSQPPAFDICRQDTRIWSAKYGSGHRLDPTLNAKRMNVFSTLQSEACRKNLQVLPGRYSVPGTSLVHVHGRNMWSKRADVYHLVWIRKKEGTCVNSPYQIHLPKSGQWRP